MYDFLARLRQAVDLFKVTAKLSCPRCLGPREENEAICRGCFVIHGPSNREIELAFGEKFNSVVPPVAPVVLLKPVVKVATLKELLDLNLTDIEFNAALTALIKPDNVFTGRDRGSIYRREYLRSEWWLSRRERARKLADQHCQFIGVGGRCHRYSNLDTHHHSYDRLYGELDRDLEVLCRHHHLTHECMKVCCINCGEQILKNELLAEEFTDHHVKILGDNTLNELKEFLGALCADCSEEVV